MNEQKNRIYCCIDLKSFYASVECTERGLDPFAVNLVVADPERGPGTIVLAVSPAMKALGVPGRCRYYEIPGGIDFITAPPRMSLYMRKSAQIMAIYRRFVCPDDMHVYSVDECFIDITDYLRLYRQTPREFADTLRGAVFAETGICATVGIGTNLFLVKVALDVLAKHAPDFIAVLDEESFREKIWYHRPLTDVWNVGPATAEKLAHFGVYDLHGITTLPQGTLWRTFGVNARFLWDHAHGIEPCTIREIRAYRPRTSSLTSGQVLFRDYRFEEARVVMQEMVEQLTLELVRRRRRTGWVSLAVGYAGERTPGAGKSRKLPEPTQSYRALSRIFDDLWDEAADSGRAIRRLQIGLGALAEEEGGQLSFLTDTAAQEKERAMLRTVAALHDKWGKNAVVRGRDFLPCATQRARNETTGGHRT